MTGEERVPDVEAYTGLGDWTPDSLLVPGVVRPVVSAPHAVLSRASDEVDPTAVDLEAVSERRAQQIDKSQNVRLAEGVRIDFGDGLIGAVKAR